VNANLKPFNPDHLTFLDHGPEPTLTNFSSQLCTASQFDEPAYGKWCRAIHEIPAFSRKQWEFVYIAEVLSTLGFLRPDARGLGFGVGKEPLAALFAQQGCEVLATDLDPTASASAGWIKSDQHAAQLADLNAMGICDDAAFASRVKFRAEDMNNISPDLREFDFTWSACAFEHLGSIRQGIDFFVNSLACLKPGGVAVHTTEFNLTSNFRTIEAHDLVVFRRFDIDELCKRVTAAGCEIFPINFNPGTRPLDRVYDVPPYKNEHLRLQLDRYVFTSIGLIARKR